MWGGVWGFGGGGSKIWPGPIPMLVLTQWVGCRGLGLWGWGFWVGVPRYGLDYTWACVDVGVGVGGQGGWS